MSNLTSYIKWRGDLSFEIHPFNEVDNVVLTELIYLDLLGIVPQVGEASVITVHDAIERAISEGRRKKSATELDLDFFTALKDSKRFRDIKLFNFRDVSDLDGTDSDFAAMYMELNPETVYIAYRGTGEKLLGWKEDFSMSFQVMPAQIMASEYLNETYEASKKYYLGGHSKGGTLAVYASAFASSEIQEHILKIYSNDGPGFCEDVISHSKIEVIRDKILHIVPEFCVIGALFEIESETIIIKSENDNMMSHDAMTWIVEGDQFVRTNKHSPNCKLINEVFDQWIESADMEHRMAFTNNLFKSIESSGITSVEELSQSGVDSFMSILVSVTQMGDITNNMLRKLMHSIFSTVKNINVGKLLTHQKFLFAIVCLFGGLFIALNPVFAVNFSGITIGVVVAVFLGKRLLHDAYESKGTKEAKKTKTVIQMILMCLMMYLISEKTILMALSNLLIAVGSLYFAYKCMVKTFATKKLFPWKMCGIIVSIVAYGIGLLPIIVGNILDSRIYMVAVGCFISCCGFGMIIYQAYLSGKTQRGY